MSWVIIKRNNNLWNIWSTNTDSYILDEDCSLSEIEGIVIKTEIEQVKEREKKRFEHIRQGNPLYFKTEDFVNKQNQLETEEDN